MRGSSSFRLHAFRSKSFQTTNTDGGISWFLTAGDQPREGCQTGALVVSDAQWISSSRSILFGGFPSTPTQGFIVLPGSLANRVRLGPLIHLTGSSFWLVSLNLSFTNLTTTYTYYIYTYIYIYTHMYCILCVYIYIYIYK